MKKVLLIFPLLLILACRVVAQEVVAPIGHNPILHSEAKRLPKVKTTALSLPFFEDFTGASPFPDNAKWLDRSVYVNNTMGVSPISRGVATFDALNAQGGPYDSTSAFILRYADSLTSQPIDLSAYQPGDSIYLSFFFQPQGAGFSPEPPDSLMLYFQRTTGIWTKMWAVPGATLDSFRQVMIPVSDTGFLHASFQFRFVNKASINLNDDVWNLDYIRLDANRTAIDTALDDVATTSQPTNLLNDFTSMPFRQFKANMAGALATQHIFSGRNLSAGQQSVVFGYTAREAFSNTPLFPANAANGNLAAYEQRQYGFPVYSTNYSTQGSYDRVVFENKYFLSNTGGGGSRENDTIIHNQIFDNYLSYDDGTAEKSYFLKQGATLPAKTAIEFSLNQPDTLRGVAIYFARQVPLAFGKFFDIAVYPNITVGSYLDTALYTQELNFPGYVDTVNHFWVYRFDTPVPLPAGTFYIGTIQPAQSGSDSLYFGLDVNRRGGNHLYVNTNGTWQPSIIQGAVMMRPILGQPVIGTRASSVSLDAAFSWSVYPVPSANHIHFQFSQPQHRQYRILDMQGRLMMEGEVAAHQPIEISDLPAGIYFVRILAGGQWTSPKKIIKIS